MTSIFQKTENWYYVLTLKENNPPRIRNSPAKQISLLGFSSKTP